MKSQEKRIRESLLQGKVITPLDALHQFNCFRLSARIYDLRKNGLNVSVRNRAITSDGKTKYVAEYYIKKP